MNDLEKMNLNELKDLARDLQVPNRSKLRKAELVLALLSAQRGSASGQQEDSSDTGSGTKHRRIRRTQSTRTASARMPALSLAGSDQPGAGVSSVGSSTGAAKPAPSPSHGPHGDPGLPIPEQYGRDTVVLMVQDPHHLYAWWELSGGNLSAMRAESGEDGTPVLIIHGPHGPEQREIDLNAGNYYLSVAAGNTYSVDLALRTSTGNLLILASSQAVTPPIAGPSDAVDEEWMAVDETFNELLQQAGLPGESLSSAERLRTADLTTQLWAQTRVNPLFSGTLVGMPSSHSLGSSSLSSWSLAR